ncbi:MAG: DUF1893 domain-containing protein [Sphaerochaetaceae bacterium]|jgi:hypothetical protein|nr:DUF1893 domain-containing protein [Sphaerochaetaceae bacterium]NLO59492.1 DUF1893 domain-containing protein [Spirochaetales bacterium]MDD2405234.1 DUF1893 domain-containing protein [Sphaerochaetaceae bacterium]MDD3670510.1 DUF1893 domain-containing protein [Sphaerochaetaceae bacterium]MDD4259162.1 DUF1893 domain-containing protein [Sphaerochaetaceae bacterium]
MNRTTLPSWLIQRSLPKGISLQVLDNDQHILFESTGKWLHPLLELERYVITHPLDTKTLFLHDRVTGRAAAALTVLLGFSCVKSKVLSKSAELLFTRYSVAYAFDEMVDRIDCMTEQLIDDSMTLETIRRMIENRITTKC